MHCTCVGCLIWKWKFIIVSICLPVSFSSLHRNGWMEMKRSEMKKGGGKRLWIHNLKRFSLESVNWQRVYSIVHFVWCLDAFSLALPSCEIPFTIIRSLELFDRNHILPQISRYHMRMNAVCISYAGNIKLHRTEWKLVLIALM